MRLKTLKIKNFRAYQGDVTISIANLTAFVGKNDVGKSTIFDALGVFFEHDACKIDAGDICKWATDSEVRICCIFDELPALLVLDDVAVTSLPDEHLVNEDGDLELVKVWSATDGKLGKPKMLAIAFHPTATPVDDLLSKKNKELKDLAKSLSATVLNLSSNVELRRGIWAAVPDLQRQRVEVILDKGDNQKAIGEQLIKALPTFALFRADRPSTDEDSEVQDPMKLAIKEAMLAVQAETAQIIRQVQEKALDVAHRTVEKLKDFDATLASELNPTFKSEPKWDGLFKLSLTGDDDIPINKRGSGVRRLILFSFFRAEAERKRHVDHKANIIYAVEEPETAQHPDNQRKVIESLRTLSELPGCQVMLTTHVPALAGLVPVEALRYVTREPNSGRREVMTGTDDVFVEIASALGVLASPNASTVKVLVCVEGPHDIQLLRHLNRAYRAKEAAIDLRSDQRVAMIPLGGNTLEDWVTNRYLKAFKVPEVHIYDSDPIGEPKYAAAVTAVNLGGDGSWATLTQKLMGESYLHHEAIADAVEAAGLPRPVLVPVGDNEDVYRNRKDALARSELRKNFKAWLNSDAASFMTYERIVERGAEAELKTWFDKIAELACR